MLRPSFPAFIAFLAAGCAALWVACEGGPKDSTPAPCPDQTQVADPSGFLAHRPKQVSGVPGVPAGLTLASKDSVAAFFGGRKIKLAFVLGRDLYLVSYDGGDPVTTLISEGDEHPNALEAGQPNSPLFSPDGAKLAYAGTLFGRPVAAFVRQALPGGTLAWRIPVDTAGLVAAEPRWAVDAAGKTWIYFVTGSQEVGWSARCGQMGGSTYRAEVLSDSAMGDVEATGWPGAFKGGLSRDGRWAGTSFSPSALYDTEAKRTTLLAWPAQQCNPSMNPFAPGSRNSDYMMILAFGGDYRAVGGAVSEAVHENLWIYDAEDRIVWRARRPDEAKYAQWQKPEWSTHPDYATAVALFRQNVGAVIKGDLYAVRIGPLADNDEGALQEAAGYFKLAEGDFTESSWSHLWVEQ